MEFEEFIYDNIFNTAPASRIPKIDDIRRQLVELHEALFPPQKISNIEQFDTKIYHFMKIDRNLLLEFDWRVQKLIGETKRLIKEDIERIYTIVKAQDESSFDTKTFLANKK